LKLFKNIVVVSLLAPGVDNRRLAGCKSFVFLRLQLCERCGKAVDGWSFRVEPLLPGVGRSCEACFLSTAGADFAASLDRPSTSYPHAVSGEVTFATRRMPAARRARWQAAG